MGLKGLLLTTSSISLLLGIGSCTASFLLPDPSPSTDWSISNGMHKWDSMKDQYPYLITPDWCEEMAMPQDGGYSEVTCYTLSGEKRNQNVYDSVRCIFEAEAQGLATSCELKPNSKSVNKYKVGKWKRFFGNDTHLPEEQFIIHIRNNLDGWGLILIFIITPISVLLFLIAALTSGRKKKIQTDDKS